jgi:hypothetical protein
MLPSATSLSIVAGISAALALYQGIDGLRWSKGRRSWLWLAAAPPLLALAGLLFWHSMQHPSPAEPLAANMGFGPEWDCSVVGQGTPVCLRDPFRPPAPAAQRKTP